jgi:hypothetical protein
MAAFGGMGAQPAVNPNNDFTVRAAGRYAAARSCCPVCVRSAVCACLHPVAQLVSPPSDGVSAMCWSPKQNYLIATSWDNMARAAAGVWPAK